MQHLSIDDARTESTLATIRKFDAVINQHDLASVMGLVSPDAVWENTYPAPDGERYEGGEAIRAAFERFFQESPQATFEMEELFACGERAVLRWRYHWVGSDGAPGHVRGVDVLRVHDGKVVEFLSYVKG
jgi:ketosteroid isomerase-like protein